jgi:hypothetical protein
MTYGMNLCQWVQGLDFPNPSRLALGPTQPPTQRVPGRFAGGKSALVVKLTIHLHLSAEVKNEWSYNYTAWYAGRV